ncbi:CC0125/CC1285 family lipoprotein [Roseospira visakhapatnamensis]|uniref:Uncharacterized protein n=1 Tax=Roseospira visakhapatnamensis TaxID=390880 RepID=A0A7W6WA09_9PROT|nr:hypothetical protein [Roseospira visakhapatnamensis]MBB4266373.1 hypothetical protein [Roseospira visakhapatnamensis]
MITRRSGWPVALAVALLVAACATGPATTPYQAARETGYGYGGQQIGDARFRVTFSGNSRTPRETVESYLLYRAAEVTLQRGYDAFVVVDKDTERFTRTTMTGPRVGVGYGRGWGYPHARYRPYRHPYHYRGSSLGLAWHHGAYGPTTTKSDHRYTASATIVMRRGRGPWWDPAVHDARSVVRHVGPGVVLPADAGPAGVAPVRGALPGARASADGPVG